MDGVVDVGGVVDGSVGVGVGLVVVVGGVGVVVAG